ncbi:MAG: DUF1275 domain-containing protein [Eubacterium sp.]|nr:DUF1275 domain-containing protein [Eubacterium sp.]
MNNKHKSDTLLLGALLSLSGGFQDAYTYVLRGNVFANAQTGNVVFMSQHMMTGDFSGALLYFLPLVAFASGILVAEQIAHIFKKINKVYWRHIILILEIIVLFVVGFLPEEFNALANILVSFSCAMQVQAFRSLKGHSYASTMCIGNLRSGTESLSKYLRTRNKSEIVDSLYYFGIILIFAIGAGLGSILSGYWGFKTILISCVILLLANLSMIERKSSEPMAHGRN